ncbi:MAG TPA: hypothetical protein PLD88_06190, partial [Candidatus Berkiella sp.]|nr:hypothetical protein [Candidatus Berkiella sp.]
VTGEIFEALVTPSSSPAKPKRMPKVKTSVQSKKKFQKKPNIIEIDLTDDEILNQPEESPVIEISDSEEDADSELDLDS